MLYFTNLSTYSQKYPHRGIVIMIYKQSYQQYVDNFITNYVDN